MEQTHTRGKIVSSLFWKLLENGGSQGVQFIVSIVLARLLTPDEYRSIALITIFITIANVLVQSGFATALIQKKDTDILDYSSVFILSIFTSLIVYIVLFIFSPTVANIYQKAELEEVLKVMGIIVFPGAVISIQNAYIAKKMEFNKLFIATFIAAIISGVISIFLAMKDFKVWALVSQQIIYYFVLMIILFILVDWFPKKVMDFKRVEKLFSFGWKVLVASLIDTIFSNMQGLVMGKIYENDTLGNFNRGEQFPKIIVLNISSAIQSVMLPVTSAIQDNKEKVKIMLRNSVMISSYLVFPMMFGMIAVGENLILLLLGEKWSGAVIFLRLMCIAYSFWPIHIANLQAINSIGRSDLFLGLEFVKKILGVVVLVIGIQYGAVVLIALKAFSDFLCTFINAAPNKKLLNYSIFDQWKDIIWSMIISAIMGVIVFFIGKCLGNGLKTLLVQLLSGIIVYLVLSYITRNESFGMIMEIVRKRK